jgi:transposase-like protein
MIPLMMPRPPDVVVDCSPKTPCAIDDGRNRARLEHAVHLVEYLQRTDEILECGAANWSADSRSAASPLLEFDAQVSAANILGGDAHEGILMSSPVRRQLVSLTSSMAT